VRPTRFRRRGKPIGVVTWLGLSIAVLAADYFTSRAIQFAALFVIPVSLAAWWGGRAWGLLLAVALPLSRLYLTTIDEIPSSFLDSSVNAAIRIAVLGAFAWLVDRTARQSEALAHRVGLLEGLYPDVRRVQESQERRGTLGAARKLRHLEGT